MDYAAVNRSRVEHAVFGAAGRSWRSLREAGKGKILRAYTAHACALNFAGETRDDRERPGVRLVARASRFHFSTSKERMPQQVFRRSSAAVPARGLRNQSSAVIPRHEACAAFRPYRAVPIEEPVSRIAVLLDLEITLPAPMACNRPLGRNMASPVERPRDGHAHPRCRFSKAASRFAREAPLLKTDVEFRRWLGVGDIPKLRLRFAAQFRGHGPEADEPAARVFPARRAA